MENLVITFEFKKGNINQIITKSNYETLVEKFSLNGLKEILLDDDSNCLNVGENPKVVTIDVYDNGRLVPIEAQVGTLEHFLGEPYGYKVEGKKLNNLHVFSN